MASMAAPNVASRWRRKRRQASAASDSGGRPAATAAPPSTASGRRPVGHRAYLYEIRGSSQP